MTPPTHVTFVTERASLAGGAERYVVEAARGLRERGLRCTLLYDVSSAIEPEVARAFDGAFPWVEPGEQLRELRPDLLYVHQLAGADRLRALHDSGIPVVRFFHDHRLFCLREHKVTTLGGHACREPLGSQCYTCLGFVRRSDTFPGVSLTSLSPLRAELRENQRCAALVVGSGYMAEHVAAHGLPPDRIEVNPLFANPPAPGVEEVPAGAAPIVFAGSLLFGKGLDVLLGALAQLDASVRASIIGSGADEGPLRALTRTLGLSERVRFHGALPPELVRRHMNAAACVVFPSRVPETFGRVGVEAMSVGVPVVASNVGGVGEWLVDGETGLLTAAGDSRGLAAAIGRILGDSALRRRLGEAALARYEARFRPEHHFERLLSLFEKVTTARVAA